MKTNVKIAIIGAIATVLAAVIPVVISRVYREPVNREDTIKYIQQQGTNNTQNVVTGELNAEGDVIVGGTKTTNIYLFPEYPQLLKEIEDLEQDLKDIPLDKTVSRLNKSKKLEEKRKQLQDFRQEVLRLAWTFSKIEINTERLKKHSSILPRENSGRRMPS